MKNRSLLQVLSGPAILLVLAIFSLVGCPNWNRPKCPRTGVYSCVSDQPMVCSPTGELTPIGDEACALQGRMCAIDPADQRSYCAPIVDAGVSDASQEAAVSE